MAKDTEHIILEVARKQFVKNGYSGTRMQEIADEAGINKAMLHYYFRSKEKLYNEVLDYTLNFMIPRLANAIGGEGAFWDRVEKIIDVYISTLMEHPDIPFFMMYELSQKQESFVVALKKKAIHFGAMQSFIMQIFEEVEAGNIKDIPPLHFVLNLMSMTVFPFIAKPVFCTVAGFPEADFESLMLERKGIILEFLKSALRVD